MHMESASVCVPRVVCTDARRRRLHSQVLALYRECLRVARTKAPALQADIKRIAGQEFREHKGVARTDIERIEYLLRRGAKQLDRSHQPEPRPHPQEHAARPKCPVIAHAF